jgi:hypothetical protein
MAIMPQPRPAHSSLARPRIGDLVHPLVLRLAGLAAHRPRVRLNGIQKALGILYGTERES